MVGSVSRRLFVATVCFAVAIALMLAPLAGKSPVCEKARFSARSFVVGDSEVERLTLNHFGNGILLATLSGILVDPHGRFDDTLSTHRCARRYFITVVLECLLYLMDPWIYHFCVPHSIKTWVHNIRRFVTLLSLVLLAACGLERLRLLSGKNEDGTTGKCLLAISLTSGVTSSIIRHDPGMLDYRPICLALDAISGVTYVGAQCSIFSKMLALTTEALAQTSDTLAAAKWARWSSIANAVSMTTTFTWLVFAPVFRQGAGQVAYYVLHVCDRWSDVTLALLGVGLVGPAINREAELAELGEWVRVRRERQILEAMYEAARAISGPSLLLAALFEGADPDELLVRALVRFRCISWDVLKQQPEIIIGGGTLDVVGPGSEDLYKLSMPGKFSECDAFLSHSWRDDASLKWDAISRWCELFRQQHSRPPKLWLDKVCIEQANIQQDLQCLPIFLAACNTLVVCCGQSYTRRLWCCVELFVYVRMLAEDDTRHAPVLLPLFANDEELRELKGAWRSFDARLCECSVEEDKSRIMGVIERNPGEVLALNASIRDLGVGPILGVPEEQSHSEGANLQSDYNVEEDESILSI
eukprot:TRINITY_DN5451_c1_g1_i2.p1 TRINITY_DN5451_c1_g1~~TRINITY_DN5451_c1_g1_i2.p1  ORF type:complete len:586 (+),score=50.55 TRINITY_DN5451_c1_g1_i2:66-1823(+)